jgi:hypothetical protein
MTARAARQFRSTRDFRGLSTPMPREDPDTSPTSHTGLFSAIHGSLPAKAYSAADGKFRFTLRPGQYSVFVEDGNDSYCNAQSSGSRLCVVAIPDSNAVNYDVSITYAASF